jgi:pyruvate ferredoxin oxidoreductase gamma subunit
MFQVRIHGRGGQGVVTAAELLSVERTGAPVVAFCRTDDVIKLDEPGPYRYEMEREEI